ncbi:heterokaryon incompatibility protein-domain-containing protein [Lasiosphaeris hirsuta]|uniref:Heterokaryon incompatibility protein-domain-containing protein n=1 Tax=Lasiosphaeris hirsuta TaxID=260670 RepID=A0AA40AGN2_9PEZI|nr:heterokaryon incompatibility protein-domain-containing protein [Lasiosphaeris hirsuta]
MLLELVTVPIIKTSEPGCRYTALSYMWGTGSKVRDATVDGQAIEMTENLYLALREISSSRLGKESIFGSSRSRAETEVLRELVQQLRQEPRGPQGGSQHRTQTAPGTYLWVDALCINQADVSERNQQVSIMGQIYSNALRVISWLGVDDKARHGIKAVQILGQHVLDNPDDTNSVAWLAGHPRACKKDYNPQADVDDVFKSGSRFWDSLHNLNHIRYWRRIWIIQELVLAKEVWFLARGIALKDEVLWAYLDWRQVLYRMEERPKPDRIHPDIWSRIKSGGFPQDGHIGNIKGLLDVHTHRQKVQRQGSDPSFADFSDKVHPVLKFAASNCTDPRDKIYGLLGIMNDEEIPVPDYSLPIRDVYTDFFKRYVNRSQCLNMFLGRAGIDCLRRELEDDLGLPSWIPDLHRIATLEEYPENKTVHLIARPLRDGAGGADEPQVSVQGHSLMAMGAFVDIVSFVYPQSGLEQTDTILATLPPHTEAVLGVPRLQALCKLIVFAVTFPMNNEQALDPDNWVQNVPLFLLAIVRASCPYELTPEIWTQFGPSLLFAKTGIRSDPHNFNRDLQEKILGDIPMPFDWRGRSATALIHDEAVRRTDKLDVHLFEEVSEAYLHGSFRPFHTNQGHIGLGPYRAQSGDRLAVIVGYVFPVVLRPVGVEGKWSLVGACIVAGIMNGEALRDNVLERIEIC